MAQRNSPVLRNSPFGRPPTSPQLPNNSERARAQSAVSGLQAPQQNLKSHTRNQSFSPMSTTPLSNGMVLPRHKSDLKGLTRSSTFAPSFIKTEEMQRRDHSSSDAVSSIDGENDFSGKKYVWLKDPHTAFVKGWIVDELEGGMIRVQCDDGSVGEYQTRSCTKLLTHNTATRSRHGQRRQSKPGQVRQGR